MDQTIEKLQVARVFLRQQRPYYSAALFALQFNVTDKAPTLRVDKRARLYANPEYVEKTSVPDLAFVLEHEINHLLRDHDGRSESMIADHKKFNIAGDLEINDDLAEIYGRMPDDAIHPSQYGFQTGLMAEQYYALLEDDPSGEDEHNTPGAGGCGSCAHGDDSGDEPGDGDGDNDAPSNGAGQGMDQGDRELMKRQVAHAINEDAEKSRGNIPGGLKRWAEKAVKPKFDPRRQLAAAVRNAITATSGATDYTYRRPNRRHHGDIVMPSLYQPVPNVGVVIDTSGSIGERELEMAIGIVDKTLKGLGLRQGIDVLSCDATVQTAQRVMSARKIRTEGGGGTDMRVGIQAAIERKPRPDVVIVVTDSYTPWPTERPKGVQVVACIVGTELANVPEMWRPPSWIRAIEMHEA